jgi:hypothetical protein
MEEVKKQGMESLFIPYEIALDLKELGFDEPCFGYYKHEELLIEGKYKNSDHGFSISAPTYSQAFRWFREKYILDSFVKHLYKSTIKVGYYFGIDEYKGVEFQMDFDVWYNTYEEAEHACLIKLIEIVKKK